MIFIHVYGTVPAVDAQPFGPIELRIVRDRSRSDAPRETLRVEQCLDARKFRNAERALHRIVAPCIDEDHDGRVATEEFDELQKLSILILQHDGVDRFGLKASTRRSDCDISAFRQATAA